MMLMMMMTTTTAAVSITKSISRYNRGGTVYLIQKIVQ